MVRAVIFDLDGLILDTESPEFLSWQTVYSSHGTELTLEEWLPCIGTADVLDPFVLLETKSGKTLDRVEVRAARHEVLDGIFVNIRPLPGVLETIAAAQKLGLKIGVASSSPRVWVERWLDRFDIRQQFSSIRCREDVAKVKPDPALYLQSLKMLGVRAEEAIALEDSLNGLRAARAAGIFTVVIPNAMTRHMSLGEAELILESMTRLPLAEMVRERVG